MSSNPAVFAHDSLRVQVFRMPPYAVAQWRGRAPDAARGAALEAIADLLAREGEHVVLDFTALGEVGDGVAEGLVRGLTEAQRLGRAVTLVRCAGNLYRRFQRLGLGGHAAHAASLLGATRGLSLEPPTSPSGNVDLYLRSTPDMLPRLRSVVTAVAREADLTGPAEIQVKTAVTEAAANAIRHGSPEGVRNHVRVSFHVDRSLLIVDVADQGKGFDPAAAPAPPTGDLPEHGYGLRMIRQSMDCVEFFQDESGTLVRMTKYLQG